MARQQLEDPARTRPRHHARGGDGWLHDCRVLAEVPAYDPIGMGWIVPELDIPHIVAGWGAIPQQYVRRSPADADDGYAHTHFERDGSRVMPSSHPTIPAHASDG